MKNGCDFFDSQAWDERLKSHVGRVWDLETTLRRTDGIDTQRRIDDIATVLNSDPESLAVMPLETVLTMDNADALDLSLANAASVWSANQEWLPESCPHKRVKGTNRCHFHLAPDRYESASITPEEVTKKLIRSLDPEGGQQKCFIGVHLANLDLSDEHIERIDSASLDFRLATIESTVDCSDAHFGPPITMAGADLCQDGQELETTTGEATNRYISVDGDIDFSGAKFEDSADFKHAHFRSATTFNDAVFNDVAMFNYATFEDQVETWSTFAKKADFSKATIKGSAQLRGVYQTAAIFNYTTFEDDVVLWNSTFEGKAEFLATEFEGAFDSAHATFDALTRFCETTFHQMVDLTDATFTDTVRFRRICAPDEVIDLQGARLAVGCIELNSEQAHYDLANATIGKVSVAVTDGITLPTDPFDYLRIQSTDFEGFDFSGHANTFKPGWRLDDLAASWPAAYQKPAEKKLQRYGILEDSYLRAKSGATEAGHNKAASEFFVHEMRYRRKQHATLFRQQIATALIDAPRSIQEYVAAPFLGLCRSSIDILRSAVPGATRGSQKRDETPAWQAGYRWVSNATLGLVAGYGERPQRPLVASLITVFLFAGVYRLLEVPTTAGTAYGLGYLLLSLQSFITFILGSNPVNTGFLPQFLSSIEGFAGAFLIAVFVFTLTRSIHR